ncbi:unnamed protein product [Pedinophyceae sp. YPF-701]|nr:unnamed protein product [Pedinophyceae sp. YPF-701]
MKRQRQDAEAASPAEAARGNSLPRRKKVRSLGLYTGIPEPALPLPVTGDEEIDEPEAQWILAWIKSGQELGNALLTLDTVTFSAKLVALAIDLQRDVWNASAVDMVPEMACAAWAGFIKGWVQDGAGVAGARSPMHSSAMMYSDVQGQAGALVAADMRKAVSNLQVALAVASVGIADPQQLAAWREAADSVLAPKSFVGELHLGLPSMALEDPRLLVLCGTTNNAATLPLSPEPETVCMARYQVLSTWPGRLRDAVRIACEQGCAWFVAKMLFGIRNSASEFQASRFRDVCQYLAEGLASPESTADLVFACISEAAGLESSDASLASIRSSTFKPDAAKVMPWKVGVAFAAAVCGVTGIREAALASAAPPAQPCVCSTGTAVSSLASEVMICLAKLLAALLGAANVLPAATTRRRNSNKLEPPGWPCTGQAAFDACERSDLWRGIKDHLVPAIEIEENARDIAGGKETQPTGTTDMAASSLDRESALAIAGRVLGTVEGEGRGKSDAWGGGVDGSALAMWRATWVLCLAGGFTVPISSVVARWESKFKDDLFSGVVGAQVRNQVNFCMRTLLQQHANWIPFAAKTMRVTLKQWPLTPEDMMVGADADFLPTPMNARASLRAWRQAPAKGAAAGARADSRPRAPVERACNVVETMGNMAAWLAAIQQGAGEGRAALDTVMALAKEPTLCVTSTDDTEAGMARPLPAGRPAPMALAVCVAVLMRIREGATQFNDLLNVNCGLSDHGDSRVLRDFEQSVESLLGRTMAALAGPNSPHCRLLSCFSPMGWEVLMLAVARHGRSSIHSLAATAALLVRVGAMDARPLVKALTEPTQSRAVTPGADAALAPVAIALYEALAGRVRSPVPLDRAVRACMDPAAAAELGEKGADGPHANGSAAGAFQARRSNGGGGVPGGVLEGFECTCGTCEAVSGALRGAHIEHMSWRLPTRDASHVMRIFTETPAFARGDLLVACHPVGGGMYDVKAHKREAHAQFVWASQHEDLRALKDIERWVQATHLDVEFHVGPDMIPETAKAATNAAGKIVPFDWSKRPAPEQDGGESPKRDQDKEKEDARDAEAGAAPQRGGSDGEDEVDLFL